MQIVLAKDSHVPEIIEIWKEFMDFHKNVDSFFSRSEDGPSKFDEFLRDLVRKDDSQVLVALEEGRVVAYSIAQIAKHAPVFQHQRYGFISDLAVKSDYQRKGTGARVLAKIFEWFESHKIDRIELRVAAKNQMRYSFWKKHGFRDYIHILYLNR